MASLVAQVKFRALSPLFLGGADPRVPELRAASLKSAIRSWYRAADPFATGLPGGNPAPELPAWPEHQAFGGVGRKSKEGRSVEAHVSPVLLRVQTHRVSRFFDFRQLDVRKYDRGAGKGTKNGLKYATFSLHMGANTERQALPADAEFTVSLVVRQPVEEPVRRAWLSGLWLLGAVGALGTRSRRGLGSLEILNWAEAFGAEWRADAEKLPVIWSVSDAGSWTEAMREALAVFDEWFGNLDDAPPKRRYPHLGHDFDWIVLSREERWDAALASGGLRLQDFRLRSLPDYADVKDMLLGKRPLAYAPRRAAFGLPLVFRFSSAQGVGSAEFFSDVESSHEDRDSPRHASLLRLRLVRLGKGIAPVFLRLDGAVPGHDVSVRFVAPNARKSGVLTLRSDRDAMQAFFDELNSQAGRA